MFTLVQERAGDRDPLLSIVLVPCTGPRFTLAFAEGSARQVACELMNLIDELDQSSVHSSLQKQNFCYFFFSSFTIDVRKCLTLDDVLIHHIVNMKHSDDTLPILQNFKKTI